MKKFLTSLIILLAIFVSSSLHASRGIEVEAVAPVTPLGQKEEGKHWLFVIGIDTYIEWPRLNTAVNDAKAVRDALHDRYYFDQNHLVELYDEEATRANILGKLRDLAKQVKEEDSLLIFYAGHGHLDPITKAGSWIPVESGIKDVSAWLSNNDIKNYLRVDAIKAKHILLVSDSCFAGDFIRGHRGVMPEVTDEVVKEAYQRSSRQAITSGGLEPVSDAGFGQNSVFSHFLVKTLKENQSPFLIPSSFYDDIKAGVSENAAQMPQFASIKDTGGQSGGEYVLFLRQDSRLEDLTAEGKERAKELERLQQMEQESEQAAKKEAEEIATREKELAEMDAKIEAMKKRLGTPAVTADDSLDNILAMVEQKEAQKKRLDELRRQKEEEERKRQEEIARLKKEREEKIVESLKPEVEKYNKIVASEFGKDMKDFAWKSLLAKCPPGWADGVEEGNTQWILERPEQRTGIKRHLGKEITWEETNVIAPEQRNEVQWVIYLENATSRDAYIEHPDTGSLLFLKASGGFQFLELLELPYRFIFKNKRGKTVWNPVLDKSKLKTLKTRKGRQVNLAVTMTSQ